jgi:hypothetical protein
VTLHRRNCRVEASAVRSPRRAAAVFEIPHEERPHPQQPVVSRPEQMAAHLEEILHDAVH